MGVVLFVQLFLLFTNYFNTHLFSYFSVFLFSLLIPVMLSKGKSHIRVSKINKYSLLSVMANNIKRPNISTPHLSLMAKH